MEKQSVKKDQIDCFEVNNQKDFCRTCGIEKKVFRNKSLRPICSPLPPLWKQIWVQSEREKSLRTGKTIFLGKIKLIFYFFLWNKNRFFQKRACFECHCFIQELKFFRRRSSRKPLQNGGKAFFDQKNQKSVFHAITGGWKSKQKSFFQTPLLVQLKFCTNFIGFTYI